MSRLKILCIGDIHFKQTSLIPYYNEVNSEGISRELEKAINSLKWVESKIKELKPDLVIQLGDVFHTLNQVDSIVLIEAYNSFKSLKDVCEKVGSQLWIIGGNHDIIYSGKYVTDILPRDIHFSESDVIQIHNIKLAFIPYYDPEYKMWQEIRNIYADFVFTHTQVKGAYYNKKKQAEDGLETKDVRDKYVISGHIHIPQMIDNVYYTGSLYQNSFYEIPIDIPFGITFIDIADEVRFVQIENPVVDKLITLYPYNLDEFLEREDIDRYFVKLVTDDQRVIDNLKEYTNKYIVIPEYKRTENLIEKEYIIDSIDTKEIIREYIEKKYPNLRRYVDYD